MRLIEVLPLKQLTLREKTILLFCFVLASLTGVVYFASSSILLGSLKTAEEQSARQSLQGVLNVLAKDQEAFTSRYSDWSAWDDTYAFIQDRNEAYRKSNLVAEQFANLKVNLVLFVNSAGQVIYGTEFDFKAKQLKPLPTEILNGLKPNSLLLRYPLTKEPLTGILLLQKGPILITSQPILTSGRQGPPKGALIFGRYINADAADSLARLTRFPIEIQPFTQKDLSVEYQQARQALSPQNPIFVQPLNEKVLAGYLLLNDIYNQPALILRMEIPREIYEQGHLSQEYLMIAIVLVGLVFGGAIVFLLERFVLARLTHLGKEVNQIQAKRDLSLRLSVSGQDEISTLAQNVNEMLKALEKSHWEVRDALGQVNQTNQELCLVVKQLQDEIVERQRVELALRQSEDLLKNQTQHLEKTLSELQQTQLQLIQSEKMSSLGQLVAGVAHEINNPVNFIYGNINFAIDYVQQLLEVLKLYQQECPKPTPEVIAKLKQIDWEFVVADLPKTLLPIKAGAERIRDIVKSLRIFSRVDEGEIKLVDIHEGIESTLLILQSRLKSNSSRSGIVVVKDYGQLPAVECYAGQLNQVFMNILVNAIDAIEETQTQQVAIEPQAGETSGLQRHNDSATIKIHTHYADPDWVTVRISDNGMGMSEDVKNHLFDPFFTTKPVGQGTGLGLSISHQIIVEKHQGKLECYSTLGQGTDFVLTIPTRLNSKSSRLSP